MTREEALEVMWKNLPSDKSLPVYEALQTLIPELRPKFRVEDIAEYPLGCDNNGNLVWSIAEESDAVPVRFEEEDGEKYPVVDYKLMGRKTAKLSVEDKQLVLKDISARVPYKVKFQNENIPTPNVLTLDMTYLRMFEIREGVIFKPYLRPMSSVTEEEKKEYDQLRYDPWHSHYDENICSKVLDWLNAHHFDYRGLIEKGLALEAPDGMY